MSRVRLGPATTLGAPGSDTVIDPQVALLLAAPRDAGSCLGQDLLDGVGTTHYRVATSSAFFLDGATAQPAYVRSLDDARGTLDVWLDQAGRPVQVQATFASARLPHGINTMRVITRFADYGGDVRVVPPPGPVIPARSRLHGRQGPLGGDPFRPFLRLLFRRRRWVGCRPTAPGYRSGRLRREEAPGRIARRRSRSK